jgi:hypothetical protein
MVSGRLCASMPHAFALRIHTHAASLTEVEWNGSRMWRIRHPCIHSRIHTCSLTDLEVG